MCHPNTYKTLFEVLRVTSTKLTYNVAFTHLEYENKIIFVEC